MPAEKRKSYGKRGPYGPRKKKVVEVSPDPVSSSKSGSTPAEDALPVKITNEKPLPVLHKTNVTNSEMSLQSIAESGVLAASLERSRAKWLAGALFDKYWTKPSKKKGQSEPANNPTKESMQKLGPCRITIEPHVLDATLFTIRDLSLKQKQPIVPPSSFTQHGQSLQTPPPPKPIAQQPSFSMAPRPPTQLSGALTATAASPNSPAPGQESSLNTARQPQESEKSDVKLEPGREPVPQKTTQPEGLGPERSSSASNPSQPHPASSSGPGSIPTAVSRPSPASVPIPVPRAAPALTPIPAPSFTKPSTPNTVQRDQHQSSVIDSGTVKEALGDKSSRPPNTPTSNPGPSAASAVVPRPAPATTSATAPPSAATTAPVQKVTPDPVIQMLAQRGATNPELKVLMRIVASGGATPEQLRIFQSHIDELTALNQRQIAVKEAQAKKAAAMKPKPNIAQPTFLQAQSHPSSSIPSHAPHLAYSIGPSPMTSTFHQQIMKPTPVAPPPPPPKPDIIGIAIEFSAGNGDRYLLPKSSIMQYSPPGRQALMSFLIVRKSGAPESGSSSSSRKKEEELYQPVTLRIWSEQTRVFDSILRSLTPAHVVRMQMEETMTNLKRAPATQLALQLPRDSDNASEESRAATPMATSRSADRRQSLLRASTQASSSAISASAKKERLNPFEEQHCMFCFDAVSAPVKKLQGKTVCPTCEALVDKSMFRPVGPSNQIIATIRQAATSQALML